MTITDHTLDPEGDLFDTEGDLSHQLPPPSMDAKKVKRTKAAKAPKAKKSPTGPQPTHTSFDLLEGAFYVTRNTRMINIGLIAIFAVALVSILGLSATTWVSNNSTNAQASDLAAQNTAANAKLAKLSAAGGYTQSALQDHVSKRKTIVTQADAGVANAATLLQDLQRVAPPGTQFNTVAITASAGAGATAGGSTTTTAAPAPGGLPASQTVGSFTAIVIDPSIADAAAWQSALNSIPYIHGANVTFTYGATASSSSSSGPQSATTINLSGTLSTGVAVNHLAQNGIK